MSQADKDRNRIPENDPSKPMDSKREVEQSPDGKTDQDFPGYPHYPSKEDIMDQRTDSHRVDLDVENLPNSRNMTGVGQRFRGNDGMGKEAVNNEADPEIGPRTEVNRDELKALNSREEEIGQPQNVDNDDLAVRTGDESDVTEEERQSLEDTGYMPTTDEENLRTARLDDTDFDGDALNEESFGQQRTGAGLDMPDETDETFTEALGQGDEENKYYSLGGDRQEGNEEDPYSGPGRGEQ